MDAERHQLSKPLRERKGRFRRDGGRDRLRALCLDGGRHLSRAGGLPVGRHIARQPQLFGAGERLRPLLPRPEGPRHLRGQPDRRGDRQRRGHLRHRRRGDADDPALHRRKHLRDLSDGRDHGFEQRQRGHRGLRDLLCHRSRRGRHQPEPRHNQLQCRRHPCRLHRLCRRQGRHYRRGGRQLRQHGDMLSRRQQQRHRRRQRGQQPGAVVVFPIQRQRRCRRTGRHGLRRQPLCRRHRRGDDRKLYHGQRHLLRGPGRERAGGDRQAIQQGPGRRRFHVAARRDQHGQGRRRKGQFLRLWRRRRAEAARGAAGAVFHRICAERHDSGPGVASGQCALNLCAQQNRHHHAARARSGRLCLHRLVRAGHPRRRTGDDPSRGCAGLCRV